MKQLLLSVLTFVVLCNSNAQEAIHVIAVKPNKITCLYGSNASQRDGKVNRQNGDFLRFTGAGSVQWTVDVAEPGTYKIYFNHSVKRSAAGKPITISVNEKSVDQTLDTTSGVWGTGSYERIPFHEGIALNAGRQKITMNLPGGDISGYDFRCLELLPVEAEAAIRADDAKAKKSRASTDWLNKAGYGLMFHWTSESVNRDGMIKPYAQSVNDFNVTAFADMVQSTGAGYIIFTIGHAQPFCPAPIKSWEQYHPGHTTERDLIGEIANALQARNIKLLCYFPTHIVAKLRKADLAEYTAINQSVMTEIGERYKKKIAGYWFDGWYQGYEVYPDFSFPDFFKACKKGNPDRIIALNSWIYPPVTEWQEYWAGETASPVEIPVHGTVARGPGKGLRFQSLLIMEPYWVQQKAEMPAPRFTADALSEYIRKCMNNGGAVTINLGIYQDGTVGEQALNVMKEVRKQIRK